ncbi:peptide chain release factor N(5)-glutamine methyltransferase [Corynebacterium aurimucosum]|uniref:Release factor glutamine methyltransferase n=1 Tax=Corynebacterium aurimucosum (strain ATCC 700975 / DSM 44827 / CIP 107346 / CN-1) TaxID=548476 RepID=C3PFQ5_CORA7|nr:peptide chain release factor N(5)-glutamine methyltransferase [Corynebacterium aurimucosum]ACP32659.1 methylase of peptide chain release factor [Corynebacterium aurimucosum ATCC 700975]QQU93168.1 peptide chain release factor N(5)-glutamine methyltransferase [Corynebacterium aurimucosum]
MTFHTYKEALRDATERLRAAGVPSPEWDARLLAAHLIHCGHMDIPLDEAPMPGFDVAYGALVGRREAREPLQHILGVAWFGALELEAGPGVFIPRPETEVLADWGVKFLTKLNSGETTRFNSQVPRVVDLCAGSGALALYVAHYVPQAEVWAVELADAALAYIRRNVARHAPDLQLVQGDVTDSEILPALHGTVDLVLTNPPYVPETPDLDPEVYQDPHEAVFGGVDGMETITAMIPTIAALLRPGGRVGIEHDDETSQQVQEALRAHGGFSDIEVLKDLTGTARFVTAERGVQ